MTQSPWKLVDDGRLAQFQIENLTGQIELYRPQAGWQSLACGSDEIEVTPGRLLLPGVSDSTTLTPQSIHVRGTDLVAIYPVTDVRPFITQVYWSVESVALGEINIPLISTVISLNTHLLDATPTIMLATDYTGPAETEVAASDTSDPAMVLLRLTESGFSYVELASPIDFESTKFAERRWQRQFSEPLEKGVIRRFRVWGAIVPRTNDRELADQLQNEFVTAALPLTA